MSLKEIVSLFSPDGARAIHAAVRDDGVKRDDDGETREADEAREKRARGLKLTAAIAPAIQHLRAANHDAEPEQVSRDICSGAGCETDHLANAGEIIAAEIKQRRSDGTTSISTRMLRFASLAE